MTDTAFADGRHPFDPEPGDTPPAPEREHVAEATERPVSTDLVPASAAIVSYLPAPAEFAVIERMAQRLSESELVPQAYRRKPANIVLATMAGRPFGWDPTMSMRSFHIIEGVPSMKPEVMLALVRAAGHSVRGELSGEGASTKASVTGRRVDTGDSMSFSFSVDDAVHAGLCTVKDGRPFARSDRGKIKPWEAHPASMCWARAVSQVCRMLFSDVVLGAGYTPEELGAFVDRDGNPVDIDDVLEPDAIPDGFVSTNTAKWQLREAIGGKEAGAEQKAIARDVWSANFETDPSYVDEAVLTGMLRDAQRRLEDLDSHITDAEIVEPDVPASPPAEPAPASEGAADLAEIVAGLDEAERARLRDHLQAQGFTPARNVAAWPAAAAAAALEWLASPA